MFIVADATVSGLFEDCSFWGIWTSVLIFPLESLAKSKHFCARKCTFYRSSYKFQSVESVLLSLQWKIIVLLWFSPQLWFSDPNELLKEEEWLKEEDVLVTFYKSVTWCDHRWMARTWPRTEWRWPSSSRRSWWTGPPSPSRACSYQSSPYLGS